MNSYDSPTLAQVFGVPSDMFADAPKGRDLHHGERCDLAGRDAGPLCTRTEWRGNASVFADRPEASRQQRSRFYQGISMSTTMTGMLLQLRPGAIHEPH